VRLAVLMATQPDPRPDRSGRERNARLLSEVLRRDEERLRHQAYRHSELPDDVDDAVQSAYLLFLERYNGVGEPLAWLYTTVKREAWAIRRRVSRRRETSVHQAESDSGVPLDYREALRSDRPGPDEQAERTELLEADLRALAALKPDERRALWLLGMGFSYAEISEATGWTHTKINRCVSEGRLAVRRGR
jgi:RNA polymerase sigma factor (sigma-70 family)